MCLSSGNISVNTKNLSGNGESVYEVPYMPAYVSRWVREALLIVSWKSKPVVRQAWRTVTWKTVPAEKELLVNSPEEPTVGACVAAEHHG